MAPSSTDVDELIRNSFVRIEKLLLDQCHRTTVRGPKLFAIRFESHVIAISQNEFARLFGRGNSEVGNIKGGDSAHDAIKRPFIKIVRPT